MAEDKKQGSIGFADVISSVDKASADELAALARIEKKLAPRQNSGSAAKVSSPAEHAAPVPRSVQLAEQRKRQREAERQKAVKGNSNDSHLNAERSPKGGKVKLHSNDSNLKAKKSSYGSEITVKVISEGSAVRRPQNGNFSNAKSQSNDSQSADKKQSREEALKSLRSAQRLKAQPHIDASGRARDENGKFTSRDKVSQDKAARRESERERQNSASEKVGKSLITRLTKALSESGDPLDATSTNAAGMAAGGSFWKAGHEAYTLGKNTVGGGISSVKKMGEFIHGDKDDGSEAKRPGMLRRLMSRGASPRRTSSSVIASNAQREQRKLVEDQIEATKEGDKLIVEKLDELLKHQGGGKSSGLAKMLGGIIAGGLGKRILGGLLAALGAKKLAERIRGNGGREFEGGGLGRRRSRKRRAPVSAPDDCGCDVDLPGNGDAGSESRRKRTPKERRKEARKRLAARKARNAGGKKLPGLLKKTLIAGGTVAAGAEAASLVSDALDGADAEAKPKEASTRGTQAGKETSAPKAPEPAPSPEPGAKAAGKGVAKETESAAAKVATKGAEKLGAKAAGKVALGATLRAIPIVGQVAGAGIDGVMGWRDKEGQQSAFNLQDGQEATKRQKAEYAAANIADFGGLLSGGSRLLSAGAEKLGFHGVAQKLNFTTEDMARGLDNTVSGAKSSVKGMTDALGITKAQNEQEKGDEKRAQTVVTAIQDGAKSTVDAITNIFSAGKEAVVNGAKGTYETFSDGLSVAKARLTEPSTDNVSPDLNIGGANARNRNFRNNNFGNLQYAGQEGARLENANANGERRFARFDTPEEGIRGLGNQLMSYYNGTSKAVGYKKLQNIDQIISKYAPDNENDTAGYKASLAKQLGVGVNDKLDLQNPDVMAKMVRSISTIEGGNPQVTDKFITTALGQYQQGDGGKGKWVGQFNEPTLAKVNEIRKAQGQDAITKDAQFSGIAALNGKAVEPKSASEVTPAEPVQHAQTAKRHHATQAENGVSFRAAHLPGEDTALGKWAMEHGGAKLANAEGLRHQVGSSATPAAPAAAATSSAAAESAAPADVDQQVKDIQAASTLKPAGQPKTLQENIQAIADAQGVKPLPADDPDVKRFQEASALKPAGPPKSLQENIQAVADAQGVKPLSPDDPDLKRYQEASSLKPAGKPATLQQNIQAIADAQNSGPAAADMPAQVAQPRASSEGMQFRAAQLPGQDTAIGKWAMDHGGAKLANAEGLRHQAGSAAAASATARPNMTIPAKIPAVSDMAASHTQPTVHVANQQSFPKEIREEFAKMNKTLEKIAGHTKDAAEKSGDAAPKANTPQPAPRGSTPLSINDPLMASVAND